MKVASIDPDWESFRIRARGLLEVGASPEEIAWSEAGGGASQLSLLAEAAVAPTRKPTSARVPRAFLELGETASCHRDPVAWPWLYRVLWRLTREERWLLDDHADPDVVTLRSMERAVRRDAHKMTAFVRFRSVNDGEGQRFVAWFEPRHRIVRRTAPFFERRFPSMRWSILTPDECVHWDGAALSFTSGVERQNAPPEDELESFWLTYYAHTFNPARVRTTAMRAEMPVHYWRNMPETASIGELLRDAPSRVREMIERARTLTHGGNAEPAGDRLPADVSMQSGSTRVAARNARISVQTELPPPELTTIRTPGFRVGVAGWDYPDWAGRVYPAGRANVDRLRWVAARFDLLEVNSTFYRPASERVTRHWLDRVDDRPELRFSAKLSRVFTHDRGIWSEAEVAAVKRGMAPLLKAGRLTSLLVQFPWSFRDIPDARRHLAKIVDAFDDFPLHVEVRHASWEIAAFYDWLRDRGAGIVNIDQPLFGQSIEPQSHSTSRTAYIRLHGRNADNWFRENATRDERYDYSYSASEMRPWLARARDLLRREDVDEVVVVFNNHYRGQAVNNAEWFAAALAEGR